MKNHFVLGALVYLAATMSGADAVEELYCGSQVTFRSATDESGWIILAQVIEPGLPEAASSGTSTHESEIRILRILKSPVLQEPAPQTMKIGLKTLFIGGSVKIVERPLTKDVTYLFFLSKESINGSRKVVKVISGAPESLSDYIKDLLLPADKNK